MSYTHPNQIIHLQQRELDRMIEEAREIRFPEGRLREQVKLTASAIVQTFDLDSHQDGIIETFLNGLVEEALATERAALQQLEAKGIDVRVLAEAYDWTYDVNGELHGLTAGDQHFEPTGIKVLEIAQLQAERDAAGAALPQANGKTVRWHDRASRLRDALVDITDPEETPDPLQRAADALKEYDDSFSGGEAEPPQEVDVLRALVDALRPDGYGGFRGSWELHESLARAKQALRAATPARPTEAPQGGAMRYLKILTRPVCWLTSHRWTGHPRDGQCSRCLAWQRPEHHQ